MHVLPHNLQKWNAFMVANRPMLDKKVLPLALAALVLAGCSPQRFFYYPNRTLYGDPGQMGIAHEIVRYPSLNGKMLYGLYFPAVGSESRGTVVHLHGNF